MRFEFLSRVLPVIGLLAAFPPVAFASAQKAGRVGGVDRIAESYVRLVLALGELDPGYVDAYYGPPQWQEAAARDRESKTLDMIRRDAATALRALEQVESRDHPGGAGTDDTLELRHRYLTRQLQSLVARVDMLSGERFSFDEESRALYDAVAPTHTAADFRATQARLDSLLAGDGPLAERVNTYREAFVIPPDKLDVVFQTAIGECRRRTKRFIDLPDNESFEVEYVTDKPWSAYNWYQGNGHSLIQVNTDLPVHIDRAIDLACHEGYPGHHVYNALLEQELMRKRGWVEFSVYPLYSPQSLIAEGSANYGIEVTFPGGERVAYEKDVLFPLAGLDPAQADRYYEVEAVLAELDYAGNEAARRYLDGDFDREAAARWLVENALMSPERAAQRVRFIDTYRAYVINYNLGLDLVRAYVERRGGTADRPERRWEIFQGLLASPRLPSGLQ